MHTTRKWFMAAFAASLFTATTFATPPNTPMMDGRILEYDANELYGTYETGVAGQGVEPWGANNMLTNLYVTWDADYLYIALNGWIATEGVPNKIAIMMDVDPGNGTGATTTTNWLSGPGHITYNDVAWTGFGDETDFGLDFMIASEGSSHNLIRVEYDGVAEPDTNNVISVVDTFGDITSPGTILSAVLPRVDNTYLLNGIEARIPWDTIYGSGRFGTVEVGEVVPRNATMRLFVNLHNNEPSNPYSSPMVIPTQNTNATWAGGYLVTDTYADIVIDSTGDGTPDLALTDLTPPYLRSMSGVQSNTTLYAKFSEDIDTVTASNVANWLIDGVAPVSVEMSGTDAVLLTLADPLPLSGILVRVDADGVEDLNGNTKHTFNFLTPAASGIEDAVTVRFVLVVNSGFGASGSNPRATNFFINGDAPLDWGYPPAMTAPLSSLNVTQHYRDVVFPPGSPSVINYKYSGLLTGGSNATGENNYEAIRLHNYANTARSLELPMDGSSLVVTDWLGAVAHPYREEGDMSDYADLYFDARRGDAGVRQRTEALFTVDLSGRNLAGVTRVLMLGTDPLRGFNDAGDFYPLAGFSDYPSSDPSADVDWLEGGLDMYDDGTNGDEVAGDGIYSRLWAFSTNGKDSTLVPGSPNSLVGGANATAPYFGGWYDLRSPRSFDYKFAVYKAGTDEAILSPDGANLSHYLGLNDTNVTLTTHVWSNETLPLPPPSNAPTMLGVEFGETQATVVFTNQPGELQHGVLFAYDLNEGFREHGLRGTAVDGYWEATVPDVAPDVFHYMAYSGPAPTRQTTWWTPNPVPATGATVQVWFSQIDRNTRGWASVYLRSNLALDGTIITEGDWIDREMTFLGNGLWTVTMDVAPNPKTRIRFGFKDPYAITWDNNWWPGGTDNYDIIVGSRTTWTPERPAPGELLTVTYDATGGALEGGTNVYIHSGYNKFEGTDWSVAYETPMTNIGGEVWTTTVEMPAEGFKTFNMLFRNLGDEVTWDSEYDPLHWVVFSDEVEE